MLTHQKKEMEKRIDEIENIKTLWKQINNKTKFIKDAAEVVDRSANTLHNHWFARFWTIPKEFRYTIITLLQNQIAIQNETIKS